MQVISFDFWNTIATPDPLYQEARKRYLGEILEQPVEVVEERYQAVRSQLNRYAETWGASVTSLEAIKRVIEPFALPQGVTPYEIQQNVQLLAKKYQPKIIRPDMFKKLQRYSLYLVCNTNFISSQTIREWLTDYQFSHMLFSDELGVSKPSRDIFSAVRFHAMQIFKNIPPSNITHVGDNDVCDIKGASDMGFSVVKVASPKHTERWIRGLTS